MKKWLLFLSVVFSAALPGNAGSADFRKIVLKDGVQLNMVPVEPGSFAMGKSDGENFSDEIEHRKTLTQPFYIGKFEVTNAQWMAVTGGEPPSKADKGRDCPVTDVSWFEAVKFCRMLNEQCRELLSGKWQFTLPTEAQWEFAARGGRKSRGYKYSGSNNLKEVGWYYISAHNSGVKIRSAGSLKSNELGICDMSGNVSEWCLDDYKEDPRRSPAEFSRPHDDKSSSARVFRGGSWHFNARNCRSASRGLWQPDGRLDYLGFRLVLVPVKNETASSELSPEELELRKKKEQFLKEREQRRLKEEQLRSREEQLHKEERLIREEQLRKEALLRKEEKKLREEQRRFQEAQRRFQVERRRFQEEQRRFREEQRRFKKEKLRKDEVESLEEADDTEETGDDDYADDTEETGDTGNIDSDGDGFSNFFELKSGFQPDNPLNHPPLWWRLKIKDIRKIRLDVKFIAMNDAGSDDKKQWSVQFSHRYVSGRLAGRWTTSDLYIGSTFEVEKGKYFKVADIERVITEKKRAATAFEKSDTGIIVERIDNSRVIMVEVVDGDKKPERLEFQIAADAYSNDSRPVLIDTGRLTGKRREIHLKTGEIFKLGLLPVKDQGSKTGKLTRKELRGEVRAYRLKSVDDKNLTVEIEEVLPAGSTKKPEVFVITREGKVPADLIPVAQKQKTEY